MKKIKAFLSISLMTVLIFSTLGFSVNRHYCMSSEIEASAYESMSCCEKHEDSSCEKNQPQETEDCCDEVTYTIPGLNIATPVHKALEIQTPYLALVAKPFLVSKLFTENPRKQTSFKPPTTITGSTGRQILLKVQRFLI